MKPTGVRIAWVALGRVAVIAATIGSSMILARALSAPDYGAYQQIWMITNLAVPIFLFGLPLSLNFFLPACDPPQRHHFMIQTGLIMLGLALLFAIILTAFAPYLSLYFFNDPNHADLYRLAAWIGFGLIGSGFLESFLINYERHRALAGALAVLSILSIMTILLGMWWEKSLPAIIMSVAIFSIIRFMLSWGILLHFARPQKWRFQPKWFTSQIRYAFPVALRDGLEIISAWLDKLIISAFFSAAQFAAYFNGAMETPLVDLVVQSVYKVMLPGFATAFHQGDATNTVKLMRATSGRLGALILPLSGFLFIVAEDLMVLLFGETYRHSSVYFQIVTFMIPARISCASLILTASGRTSALLVSAVTDTGLIILFSLILIPGQGLVGPAMAKVIGIYGQVIYQNRQATRLLKKSFTELYPWVDLGKWLLIAIFSGILAHFVLIFSVPILNITAAGIVFGVIYLQAMRLIAK